MRKTFMVLAAGIAALASAPSHAATYDFSFGNMYGTVFGTVSGVIVLPDGNATNEAATSVTITSTPSSLASLFPNPILGTDLTNPTNTNSFTVSNGEITSALFYYTVTGGGYLEISSSASYRDLLLNNSDNGVIEPGNFTTFTPVATTPLPATLPLFAGGLGMIGLLGARKRRKAQAVDNCQAGGSRKCKTYTVNLAAFTGP
jgi:hypothetical protein